MNALSVLNRDIESIVTLDFETYYADDYTLSKSTTEAYVRDPRFETILAGVKVDDSPARALTPEAFAEWARTVDWSRTALLAHHAHFDGLIASHHYGIRPAFWFDTLSMARPSVPIDVGGSLKKLSAHFGLGVKGEEVILAKNMRRADFSPEQYARYGAYCCNDCDLEHALFWKLADNFPEIEFWNIDTTIRMFTEPVFRPNQPLLVQCIADEKTRKAKLLERVEQDKSVLMSNDKFAALLVEFGEDPPMKISAAKSKKAGEPVETFAFAKNDPGMQALLEHEREEIRWLAEARVGVKSTITETRAERLLGSARRGAVPMYLKYHGAHTARWSGGDKMNPQNFTRGGTLRDSLEAPAGFELVVVDSGQIEARMTAWLAGQEDLVAAFASGEDVYSTQGSSFFGRPVSKKDTPDERQVSKSMVLGMGFSMGWYKFASEMLKGMMGAPPKRFTQEDADKLGVNVDKFRENEDKIERVVNMPSRLPFEERIVHCAVADFLVRRYRRQNGKIVQLWDEMAEVIAVMATLPEEDSLTFGPSDIMTAVRHGLVMPDGLLMYYPGLRESEDGSGYSYMGGRMGKERTRIYGGLMTENVIQRLARDVVAEQMLFLRGAYGYHVAMMTHDEVVLCVEKGEGERAFERAVAAMKSPPNWCLDLPLNAEGGVGRVYGEIK